MQLTADQSIYGVDQRAYKPAAAYRLFAADAKLLTFEPAPDINAIVQ